VFCGSAPQSLEGLLLSTHAGQFDVKPVPLSASCSASMLMAALFSREYQSESPAAVLIL